MFSLGGQANVLYICGAIQNYRDRIGFFTHCLLKISGQTTTPDFQRNEHKMNKTLTYEK